MLGEVAVALQRGAEAPNLLSHVVCFCELLCQRDRDLVVFILLVQVELDGTWVGVMVSHSALFNLALVLLVGLCLQLNIFRWNDQVGLLETFTWNFVHQTDNWDAATTPLTRWRSHIVHCDHEAC